jgi:acetolactate synthase I/II/III large subunit
MEKEFITGGEAIGQVLKEEGVKYLFGIGGGHVFPLMTGIIGQGIRLIHVRHEQTGVYAADGYARASREIGVCFGTAGPGMTNMLSGISQAFICRSPVLCLFGQHGTGDDKREPIQEGYGTEIVRSMTKWSARAVDFRMLSFLTKKAARDMLSYPPGPVALEVPINILMKRDKSTSQRSYTPNGKFPAVESMAAAGNRATVEKVVEMFLSAERPVLVAGDGVHWANASKELQELVRLLQIPVLTRRIARGAFPESDPLAFSSRTRDGVLKSADLAVAIGLRIGYLEGYGRWARRLPKFVQINESETEIKSEVPTDAAIVGNPRVVLQQMIDILKENPAKIKVKTDWIQAMQAIKEEAQTKSRQEAEGVKASSPIHPAYLAQALVDFLDDSATIVYDAFTGTYYLTDRVRSNFSGKILDAGEQAGVGHGIGMGIGAQLARPGKQVLVFMGDGGMGIGGMDVETAVRYNLPVVFLVNNNSEWMTGTFDMYFKTYYGEQNNWNITPGVRYDKMFEATGCYGENVERPEEIRPALERAFNSGKPAVVNVAVDPKVMHKGMMLNMGQPDIGWLEPEQVPEAGRQIIFKDRGPKR